MSSIPTDTGMKPITIDLRSTLERADEIERDFYRLKAQEWAMEPGQAEQIIRRRLEGASAESAFR